MRKLTVAALSMLAVLVMQACSYSTAKLTDVKLCSNPNSDGICGSDQSVFKTTDAEIFLSSQLENAPSDTRVTATWTYLRGDLGDKPQQIDSITVDAKEGGTLPFYSSLPAPASGWPKGDYEVTVIVSNDNTEPITKPFSVK